MGKLTGSKLELAHYMNTYTEYLSSFKEDEIALLELGVEDGMSLLYWRDFLPHARIAGLDISSPVQLDDPTGRIKIYQGEQQDRDLLDRIAAEVAPGGFDVIVDDASHVGQFTRIAFWHLFKHHLKPGGLYFIEDWGCSYFKTYADGKTYAFRPVDFAWHEKVLNKLKKSPFVQKRPLLRRAVNYVQVRGVKRVFPSPQWGMVGFVKELVDECGAPDVTNDELGGRGPKRRTMFQWMRVSVGMVIVKKSTLYPWRTESGD